MTFEPSGAHFYRDVEALQTAQGASEVQRVLIAGDLGLLVE